MREKKDRSLSVQLTLFVFVDLLLCSMAVLTINHIGKKVIHQYYFSEQYSKQEQRRLEREFREFVDQENPASFNWALLGEWIRKEGYVQLDLYKNGYLVYNSEYGSDNLSLIEERMIQSENDKSRCIRIQMADGIADAKITNLRYRLYCRHLLLGSIVVAGLIFLFSIFIYTYCKFHYITLLSEEIQAMEKGQLSHEITVKGRDEMMVLAYRLEQMRYSFAEEVRRIEDMQKDKDDLIAEMSHDMRTPLTALVMYLGFLKEWDFADAKNKETYDLYAGKAYEKAECIKSMMDDLFFYLKMDREKCCDLEEAPASALLYEFVSEISMLLERKGFHVEEMAEVPDYQILFSSAYMDRIAGNVASNIRKYADPSVPVRIRVYREDALVRTAGTKVQVLTLAVRNLKNASTCSEEKEKTAMESMGIGTHNIQKMMEQMAGDMVCVEDVMEPEDGSPNPQVFYELRLMFRITNPSE